MVGIPQPTVFGLDGAQKAWRWPAVDSHDRVARVARGANIKVHWIGNFSHLHRPARIGVQRFGGGVAAAEGRVHATPYSNGRNLQPQLLVPSISPIRVPHMYSTLTVHALSVPVPPATRKQPQTAPPQQKQILDMNIISIKTHEMKFRYITFYFRLINITFD